MANKTYEEELEQYRAGADGVLLSQEDQAAIDRYSQAWSAARKEGDQAGMTAAHDGAEAIRAKYGYSGGGDGSQYIKLPGGTGQKSFSYETAPSYVSRYQDQIDQLTQQIAGREPFSYDPESDPRYASYKKEYAREGRRATEDVLGQYAAMTGGRPSTAAVTASQQAGDYYAAQMADKIPELYQLAYSMYLEEGERQRADLSMYQALEQGDYAKYLNLLNQYNTDRSFDYGAYRDEVSDSRYQQQYGDSREEVEYSKALDKAQTLAAAGDFSGYKALGYTDEEIAGLKQSYNAAQLLADRGSSSGGDETVKKPTLTVAQVEAAIKNERVTPAVIAAFDYYYGDGSYEKFFGGETEEMLAAWPGGLGWKDGLGIGSTPIQAGVPLTDLAGMADYIEKELKQDEPKADALLRMYGF